MAVEFRLLGDVTALVDGRPVKIGHARQRCVLLALLLDANRTVPADVVIDRVWADQIPQRARAVLRGYLSRLRQILAAAQDVRIVHGPGGYVLSVDSAALDVHRFHSLVADARACEKPKQAVDLYEQALGLWRGEAFATLDTPWLNSVRAGLDTAKFAAQLDRNDAALSAGLHSVLLADLKANAAAHPLDERLAAQLMLALYRCGRQPDALAHFQQVRARLMEELGIDPSPPLQRLLQQILTADPAVAPPAPPGPPADNAADAGAGAAIAAGRQAYERRAWGAAYHRLARAATPSADDLDRLAVAAYLTGRLDACAAAWEQAHRAWRRNGQPARAARSAFWLGLTLTMGGEQARGGGWLARAGRLLEATPDCVEHGYLLIPASLQAISAGDPATAHRISSEIAATAERFGDPDLLALARLSVAQALIAQDELGPGIAVLDETMVAVTTGEVSPIPAGIIYCAVLIACRAVFDLRRAQEWTAALSRWCAAQPDLKPYRGQCLVHRSEIAQLRGDWAEAMTEVRQAREQLSDSPGNPAMGMAMYQQAELLRLRGAYDRAEEAYRQASGYGHAVQPGLALLRLAQGQVESAAAAIRRALDEAALAVERARVLGAYAEISLAGGQVPSAASATDELERIAAAFGSVYLRAVAGHARGSVLLAGDEAAAGCAALRRALASWQELAAPYEAARTRMLIGLACARLGDADGASLEWDAACQVFRELGAAPDLARLVVRGQGSRSGCPQPSEMTS
ncbi:AfsR/SARP family transcriptional regulator [Flindersiella endophytica]